MTLKPPLRCPLCGDLPAELVKRWDRQRVLSGKTIRVPVGLIAAYHCGARIEARYVIDGGLRGTLGGAHWEIVSTAGCRSAVDDALIRSPRRRHR